jgi:hypothetical protein
MRLYNLDENEVEPNSGNDNEKDDTPGFDKSAFGQGMKAEKKESFDDWNF